MSLGVVNPPSHPRALLDKMATRLEARQCHPVLTNTHMLLAAKGSGREELFLFFFGVRIQRREANQCRRRRVEGRRRLSGFSGRRL
jgi:hypothetical protein